MTDINRLTSLAMLERRGSLNDTQKLALLELRNRFASKAQTANKIVEPALTMATGAIAEPISGFVGLAGLPFGGDVASNAVGRAQEAMTYQPRTEAGQQGLNNLGGFMQGVSDKVNPIVAGTVASLYDAIPLTKEDASDIYNQLPKQGLSGDLGSLVADKTGSPALATMASMYPTAMTELMGLKMGSKIPAKQYEFGDIGGQAFKQRGSVSSIKPLVDEFGDLVENPDKVTVYHTSPGEISKIEPEYGTGLFGDNLFFADDPYQLGDWTDETRVYRMELDENDILEADRVAFMDIDDWGGEKNYKAYRNSVEKMKDIIESSVDEDSLANYLSDNDIDILEFSEDVLSEKTSVFDLADYGADSEILADVSWTQQRTLGDLGRDTGYKAVSATDEQGRVIIAPMMGRESELVDVTEWKK